MTRLIALLGDPVSHSLSPRIQTAAFQAAGVDGAYLALRCDREDLPELLRGIARAGGGGNVTLPHKEAARKVVDEPSEVAVRTGAVNTFWLEGGRIHGDNTDVEGFRTALGGVLGPDVAGARVLLLGAGGGARAAAVALLDDGVDRVDVLNRTPSRAHGLVGDLGDRRIRVLEGPESPGGEGWDLLVNATSLGLSTADLLPLDPALLGGVGAVLDLVYTPAETPLVKEARARGIPAADGGGMLVGQGAAAFRRWWGMEAPVEVMRDALARTREAGA